MAEMKTIAEKVLSLIDLTRLHENDSIENIQRFCHTLDQLNTIQPAVQPAAICVYPQYVASVIEALIQLNFSGINIAAVANFPSGRLSCEQVVDEIEYAIDQGAGEIDVVLPWQAYLEGNYSQVERLLSKSRQACTDNTLLKVILETGMLGSSKLIYDASRLSIDSGADFIKTSTGKVSVNATLEAVEQMLRAITDSGSHTCGLKASGGIRTLKEAEKYISLADKHMGDNWVNKDHFRFGASSLLDDVISAMTNRQVDSFSSDY